MNNNAGRGHALYANYMALLCSEFTLPKTNIAPENGWLEDYFPFGKANFQVLC